MLRDVMKATLRAVPIALAMGCSATTTREPVAAADAIGCCCSYGDCRADLTQSECVKEAEFQGWTYAWHAGACTKDDRAPVLETVHRPTPHP